MKKIVVVVSEEKAMLFSGEELKASNNSEGILYVKELKKTETIAVFQKENWLYWFEYGDNLGAVKDITVGRLMFSARSLKANKTKKTTEVKISELCQYVVANARLRLALESERCKKCNIEIIDMEHPIFLRGKLCEKHRNRLNEFNHKFTSD